MRSWIIILILSCLYILWGCGPAMYLDPSRIGCPNVMGENSYCLEIRLQDILKPQNIRCVLPFDTLDEGERVLFAEGKWLIYNNAEYEEIYYLYDEEIKKFFAAIELPAAYTLVPNDFELIYEMKLILAKKNDSGVLEIDTENPVTVRCRLSSKWDDKEIVEQVRKYAGHPVLSLVYDKISISRPIDSHFPNRLKRFWDYLLEHEIKPNSGH